MKSLRDRVRGRPAPLAIARLDEISVGGARVFHYPTTADPCLLLRPNETTLLAYSQKCTHLACAVVPEPDGRRLACPCHKGYFDAATGRAWRSPGVSQLTSGTVLSISKVAGSFSQKLSGLSSGHATGC